MATQHSRIHQPTARLGTLHSSYTCIVCENVEVSELYEMETECSESKVVQRWFTDAQHLREVCSSCIAYARIKVISLKNPCALALLPAYWMSWLDLSDCLELTTIPTCVMYMSRLECLNITHCNVMELPSWIESLSNLRILIVTQNRLQYIPSCLSKLAHLEVLDISCNPLNDASLSISEKMMHLRFLNVSFTPIASLPSYLYYQPSLTRLHVDFTRIPVIVENMIQSSNVDMLTLRDPHTALGSSTYDVARRGQAIASCTSALSGQAVSSRRLSVLVTGLTQSGKANLISSFVSRQKYLDVIFTKTSQPLRPSSNRYSCCWIVTEAITDDVTDIIAAQLDSAFCQCVVQAVCFVLSKKDLWGRKSMNAASMINSVLKLAADWRQSRKNNLLLADSHLKNLALTVTSKGMYRYILEARREIKYQLHRLAGIAFTCVFVSSVTGEGIEELLMVMKRLYESQQHEAIPQLWLRIQDRCVDHLSRRDFHVLQRREIEEFKSLLFGDRNEDRENRLLGDVLSSLVDAAVSLRNLSQTGTAVVLSKWRWLEQRLELMAMKQELHHCHNGRVDLKCLKSIFRNDIELEIFVVMLIYHGLCRESSFSDPCQTSSNKEDLNRCEAIVDNFLQNRCCLLLPWLLPEEQPEAASATTEAVETSLATLTYRTLGRVPFALFHRLCLNVHNLPDMKCLSYWKRATTVRCQDIIVVIEDCLATPETEAKVCVRARVSGAGADPRLAQFWFVISRIVEVVERQLKRWRYTVLDRYCDSFVIDCLNVIDVKSVSLLQTPTVLGDGVYLVVKTGHRNSIGVSSEIAVEDVVGVFRCSHGGEKRYVSESTLERDLDSLCVRDGITALSPRIPERNVEKDPPGRPRHQEMENEQQRLKSFRRWPQYAPIAAELLAKLGFFYGGVRDEVTCYKCGIKLGQWEGHHDPVNRHSSRSPDCELASQYRSAHVSSTTVSHRITGSAAEEFPYSVTPQATSRHERTYPPPIFEQQSALQPATAVFKPTGGDLTSLATESVRRATFDSPSWPRACPVKPDDLARAGFFYTGRADSVQCFSCFVALRGWVEGDSAEGEHRRHAPYCQFLNRLENSSSSTYHLPSDVEPYSRPRERGLESITYKDHEMQFEYRRLLSYRNCDWLSRVSVGAEQMAAAGLYSVYGDTVRCFHCHVMMADWVPGDVPIEEHLKHSPTCTFARTVAQTLLVQQTETSASATAERMSDYASRLASFKNWPLDAPVRSESLAAAGFYYMGSGDRVQCFSCGGALKEWQPDDTPWREHGRYFPMCDFFQKNSPSDEAVTAAGYDEPWSHGSTTGSTLLDRKEELPPWTLPAEHRLQSHSSQGLLRPATESSTQCGFNQDFLEIAVGMGMQRAIVERVIVLNMQSEGSPYTDFNLFIDDVMAASQEAEKSKAESLPKAAEMVAEPSWTSEKVEKSKSHLASLDELFGQLQTAHGGPRKSRELQLPSERSHPFATASSPSSGTPTAGLSAERLSSASSGVSSSVASSVSSSGSARVLSSASSGVSSSVASSVSSSASARVLSSASSGRSSSSYGSSSSASTDQRRPFSVREEDELRALEDRRLCKVCMDQEIAVVFLDCGHVICCDECSKKVIECPICRQPIKSRIRAFFG